MANNASARKRIRQTEARTQRNRVVKSRIRTFRKSTLELIEEGDAEGARKAYDQLASAVDRAAKNKVIHRNAANRVKGRMAARLNKLSA